MRRFKVENPETVGQPIPLAQQLERKGKLAAAERLYRELLARQPRHPVALHLLGLLCHRTGRSREALELVKQSIAADPSVADFHCNLAVMLGAAGMLEEAVASLRKAIELRPNTSSAYGNLGVTLEKSGRLAEAIDAYSAAIAINPKDAVTHANLGNVLRKLGRLDEAEASYRIAVALDPKYYALSWQSLGGVLQEQARHDQAIAAMRHGVEVLPNDPAIHSSLLYSLHYCPGISPVHLFDEHLAWAKQHEAPILRRPHPGFPNDRTPMRRLRVGYVSPDLRRHSVTTFFEPLLAHHDRSQFELICYSATTEPDDFSLRLQGLCDNWRDIARDSDERAVERIRHDTCDILVDLTGHMGGNRLPLFCHRLAPIQITYVGHPDTTGLTTMDYRLTDPYLDPSDGGSDAYHTEELIRLPTTFGCYQEPRERIDVGPLPGKSSRHITFGCLNNPAKITEPAIRIWCRILNAVPGSQLMLLGDCGVKYIDDLFYECGISLDRVERMGRLSRVDYLKAFNQIDIALDSFPYNGQTTSCDGFWMGVPMIALTGNSYASRMGLSLLTNLGLTEWIAKTTDEYVEIAERMAQDLQVLGQIRAAMRDRLKASPIMDYPALAQNIEGVYRQLWIKWCEGNKR
jgi:protein O-GlcNAc transferase